MSKLSIRNMAIVAVVAATLAACGGGGGSSGGATGGGSGGGSTPVSFSAEITSMSLEDTRTGEAIDVTGLPVTGATVTRN